MNRILNVVLMFAGSLGVLASTAVAQTPLADFVIIVNPANPVTSLSAAELSKLFLRRQAKFQNGRPAVPVDQVESSPIRKRFSTSVHRMDVPSVRSYWQGIVFSGRGEPPIERASDAEVMAFVRTNPNGIGYVAAGTPLGELKSVTVVRNPQ